MSDHNCPVIEVLLERHPNADTLSIVRVGGYQCVVKTSDWINGSLAIYVPPDSVVPFEEPFKFLGENHLRVKARKLRGEISFGLLVPAPDGVKVGDDMSEVMGITHYEPPVQMSTGGDNISSPPGIYPKYDVENYKSPRYCGILRSGEHVVITEKIDGANARFMYLDNKMWVGSRTNWKAFDSNNIWWKALIQNFWIEEWCRKHPGLTLYGEVFGQVQNLKYGTKGGQIKFRAFDILKAGRWLDFMMVTEMDIPGDGWVPILYVGLFDEDTALKLAEGDSSIPGADHYREGVVIRPLAERWDSKLGRVQLKIVGGRYLVKS